MLSKIKAFLAYEWSQLSTKFGLLLAAVSAAAPEMAKTDPRFTYVGFAAGLLLVLWRGKAGA
jgi:type IV secretory pathway TrbD component